MSIIPGILVVCFIVAPAIPLLYFLFEKSEEEKTGIMAPKDWAYD